MSSRNFFAAILMACLLTLGFGGLVQEANAASAGQSALKPGQTAGTTVEVGYRYRHRGPRVRLRIGPNYSGYDYPYYYSRGYYPTHIGPGYLYYGHPYRYYKKVYAPIYGRCDFGSRKCGYYRGYGRKYD